MIWSILTLNCWNWMLSQFHFFVINNPEGSFCCTKEFWNDLIFKANTVKNIREACCPTKPYVAKKQTQSWTINFPTFFHDLKKITHSWELIITPFCSQEDVYTWIYKFRYVELSSLRTHYLLSPYLNANSIF